MSAAPERWTSQVTRVLAPNPGPMSLEGTNSLVIRAPGHGRTVVVDPGPDDAVHLDTLRAIAEVELILLTHHHHDHTESAARFARLTGAPVRAFDPFLCIDGAPLADGEEILAGGARLRVVATPGHTADSVSFHLPDDAPILDDASAETRPGGSMLTGDTILGRGTTIIAQPDGSLASYLRSLDRLAGFGAITTIPAHGPMLPDLSEIARAYAAHRLARLDGVREALRHLDRTPSGDPSLVAAVADIVYADVDPAVRFAAEASVHAQLEYLAQGTSLHDRS